MAGLITYQDTDIVNDTQKVVTSTWSNNTNNSATAHTASSQANFTSATSSGAFYINVYNEAASLSTTAVQYAVAYGHSKGSGSLNFTNDVGAKGNSATKCIYNQYRQLVYGDEGSNFKFNDYTPDDIYVINVNRARFKHNLKPGTLDLQLSGSGLGILHLTDDSITKTGSAVITNAGRQFNIVSGSTGVMLGSDLTQTAGSGSYGLFYPDSGFAILNARAIEQNLTSISPAVTNHATPTGTQKLFNAISGAGSFILDSEEKVSSQYYFTRIKNHEFNYTTNPSFIDTTGNLNYTSMIDNPKTYITTVGLYNNMGDLVAVAKLSQPISKDFTKEALIRVKLDY